MAAPSASTNQKRYHTAKSTAHTTVPAHPPQSPAAQLSLTYLNTTIINLSDTNKTNIRRHHTAIQSEANLNGGT
jgi:hypothetical protein